MKYEGTLLNKIPIRKEGKKPFDLIILSGGVEYSCFDLGLFKNINVGSRVTGEFEENENPNDPEKPYKNIKTAKEIEQPKGEPKTVKRLDSKYHLTPEHVRALALQNAIAFVKLTEDQQTEAIKKYNEFKKLIEG